jgi:8-oxo-dGTP diphosphatase
MNQALAFERPLVTVDIAIFSAHDDALHVLLVKRPPWKNEPFPNVWALPGGFVDVREDTDLEECALRKLKEKTGVAAPYLEQVGSVGSLSRDPRGWSTTHVYFALIGSDNVRLSAGGNANGVQWLPIDGNKVKEKLAFDHAELLKSAVERLRNKVEYTSLPAFLMPAEFTLTELQRVYEIVLNRTLEKKAFRTRMLASDLLDPLPKQKEGPNRPAQLFRLKNRKRPVFFTRTFGK